MGGWNVETNKKVGQLTIFVNHSDGDVEEDAQWVFIKTLNIEDGRLIVTSESGKTYKVDLNTKEIAQSDSRSSPSPESTRDMSDAVRRPLTNGSAGKKYDVSYHMNPSDLEGDFNGAVRST